MSRPDHRLLLFFFNDTATTEIYTLSLHDALPISEVPHGLEHPLARLGRDAHRSLHAVEDSGDGALRDPGEPPDLLHRDWLCRARLRDPLTLPLHAAATMVEERVPHRVAPLPLPAVC